MNAYSYRNRDFSECINLVKVVILIIAIAILLVSCGSGGGNGSDSSSSEDSGSSTSSGGETATMSMSSDPNSIPADNETSTAVTAELQDSSGNPVSQGTTVEFSTSLGRFSNNAKTYSTTTPDSTGKVKVSLIAGTTAGTCKVTADSNDVSQKTEITFTESDDGGTPGNPATIEVSSVERDPVFIKGSGKPETAKITFLIKDDKGNEVADGHQIDFSIDGGGTGGGESLSVASDSTTGGYVDTTLYAGTQAGTVKIKAVVNSDSGITSSTNLTISGGPPYGENMGLAPEKLNIHGLRVLGLEDKVTMRVSDKFNNEIPDGTSVSFTIDYGLIKSGEGEVTTTDSKALSTVEAQNPLPPDGFVTPVAATQSGDYARVLCMAVQPTDNDIVYIGTDGGGIFKSIDGGSNWTQPGIPENGLTNGMVWDIEIDPTNNAILYAATDDGIFRSKGSGDAWEKTTFQKNITGEYLGDLATTDTDQDGYSDSEYVLNTSSNQLRTSTTVYLAGTETDAYVFTGSSTMRFLVRDLGGNSGDAITIDYMSGSNYPSSYSTRAIALGPSPGAAPVDDRVIYAGIKGRGIYKSVNGGFQWVSKNKSLSNQEILSLAIDPSDDNRLFVGTDGGGVFRTIDAAENWSTVNKGLTGSVIHTILIDPNTADNVYVGTDADGVFYCTNATTATAADLQWNSPSTDVTSTRVTKIVLDDSESPAKELYAGTYGDGTEPLGGVYKSDDSGLTWNRLATLTENHVHALGIIAGATDTLLAGSWGRNLSKSTDGGSSWALSNGTAPDEITNQVFATTRILFSGHTKVTIVQLETGGQGAGGVEYNHNDQRDVIYNGTSAKFLYTVEDQNGNPLTAGTKIEATSSGGSVKGDGVDPNIITLEDTQSNQTYSVSWSNGSTEATTGSLNIKISDSDNGSGIASLSRDLIGPVSVTIFPSAPAENETVTVSPAGGSQAVDAGGCASSAEGGGGYKVKHPGGTSYIGYGCGGVTYTAGAKDSEEVITVKDEVTGGDAELTYTVR